VYYLVKALGKWLIASLVGVFADELAGETQGTLVPAADVPSLARALQHAITRRPRAASAAPGASWPEIGRLTRSLYEQARRDFLLQRSPGSGRAWQR
jgi:hypothetical protein